MACRTSSTPLALFLILNLLFLTLSVAIRAPCPPPPYKYRPRPNPTPRLPTPRPATPRPYVPSPTTPNPSGNGKCPRDALKLGVCTNVLNNLLNVTVGQPPVEPCCTLIDGLVDLEAAVCLCNAIKANVLGINLNIPVSLSLLLNVCSKNVPKGFQCP